MRPRAGLARSLCLHGGETGGDLSAVRGKVTLSGDRLVTNEDACGTTGDGIGRPDADTGVSAYCGRLIADEDCRDSRAGDRSANVGHGSRGHRADVRVRDSCYSWDGHSP